MCKISIIMPVYNAEKTVSRMLDSIIAQTFKEWELICVNDGSRDKTPQILAEYASKDSRIRVINKENEGVAMARQIGIENARGEYSIHADADDWVESEMIEAMITVAEKEDADIVIADYYANYNNDEQKLIRQHLESAEPQSIIKQILEGSLFGALWNKLVRTSLYHETDARFYKGVDYCEDVLIWCQILSRKQVKVTSISKPFYHYVLSDNSITHNYTRETYNKQKAFLNKLHTVLDIRDYPRIMYAESVVFLEAFVNDVLSKNEIRDGYKEYRTQIVKCSGTRWRIGLLFMDLRIYSVARKLLKF